jgi:hypothetical protein
VLLEKEIYHSTYLMTSLFLLWQLVVDVIFWIYLSKQLFIKGKPPEVEGIHHLLMLHRVTPLVDAELKKISMY